MKNNASDQSATRIGLRVQRLVRLVLRYDSRRVRFARAIRTARRLRDEARVAGNVTEANYRAYQARLLFLGVYMPRA